MGAVFGNLPVLHQNNVIALREILKNMQIIERENCNDLT